MSAFQGSHQRRLVSCRQFIKEFVVADFAGTSGAQIGEVQTEFPLTTGAQIGEAQTDFPNPGTNEEQKAAGNTFTQGNTGVFNDFWNETQVGGITYRYFLNGSQIPASYNEEMFFPENFFVPPAGNGNWPMQRCVL